MSTAVLSIGSNLGDRLANLQSAVDALRRSYLRISPVYETAPWGPVPQEQFLNAVLIVSDPDAEASHWLARGQSAELAAGRTRELRWGPRSLDVDVITVDEQRHDDPDLTVPHPRAHERAFVLVPWLVLDPAACLAGRPVAELIQQLPAGELDGVRRRPDLVLT